MASRAHLKLPNINVNALPEEIKITDEEYKIMTEKYAEEGTKRALALPNRGPITFDKDGKLSQHILDAYYKYGFYVFTNVLSPQEVKEMQEEFEAVLDNAPVDRKATVDQYGKEIKAGRKMYNLVKPLSDHTGKTPFAVFNFKGGETIGRHPMRMVEPIVTSSKAGKKWTVNNIQRPLSHMKTALRCYGHPKMLKVAEAINGPDFTPFTDTFFYKEAGVGSSTAWHQDPSNAWDEDWKNHERSGFDVGGHCGFSFHVSLYNCDANNTLWFLPGTQFNGRMLDIENLASGTGELPDRLPNAVPVICGPGDAYIQNRLTLHCAFPNIGKQQRASLQFGFNRKASVKGIRTHGYGYNEWDTYDETYIKNRQRQILWAINARKQHFPNEKPYEYAPFKGEEDKYEWNEKIRQQLIDEGYWNHTIVI